jgi:hypothetical protein
MARQRAFDHDELKRLVLVHPELPDERYAEILTDHNRASNPSAPAVNANTVSSVLHRKGAAWGVPDRRVEYADLLPPAGSVSPRHKNHTFLRYLRELAKEDRGEAAPDTESGRKLRTSALNWRDDMMARGGIVDIDLYGEPIIRHPVKSERDADGRPLALVAWAIPGWR